MISATVAVASVVSLAVENDDVELLDDVISLWNGTTPELLSPTSTAAQLANTSRAPARKMARPLVHDRKYSATYERRVNR